MSELSKLLQASPYFAPLSQEALAKAEGMALPQSYGPKEIIVHQGESKNTLFLVASGVVRTFLLSSEGKEQTLRLVNPGGLFNGPPAFDSGLVVASAEAMSMVRLYGFARDSIETLLHHEPAFALGLLLFAAEEERHLIRLVEDLSFRNVTGRIARILLQQLEEGNYMSPGRKGITQSEMAALAGTVREVVSRSLKSLEEKGVIHMERGRILVRDKKALQEMAEA